MVDKSTYMLLLLSSIVLMLSFKDLILIRSDTTEASAKQQRHEREFDEKGDDDEAVAHVHAHQHHSEDEDFSEAEATRESRQQSYEHDEDFDNADSSANPSSDNLDDSFAKKTSYLKMMKGGANVQTLKFKFCYSCGYRNAFDHYSQMVQARFPELKIVGENYTPAAWKLYLAQFLSTAKMILIGCIMFTFNPFTQFNLPTPSVFNWALQNKFYASIMLFFISNSIETHLISTGAFEIYLNDIQIWSKLASDRMPSEQELMQILDMNFNFEAQKNAAFGNTKF